jgi:replication factor C subunit 1
LLNSPTAQQIEKRLKLICVKEGLQIAPNVIAELNQSTSADIRQMINILSTYSLASDSMSFDQSKKM